MFCIDYYPYEDYIKSADQLKIKYNPTDTSLSDFLNKYIEKSVVIDVSDNFDEVDCRLFQGLCEKFKNFKLIIKYENTKHLELVQKYNVPFFFMNFVTTMDKLYGFLKYRPTDMYICEDLGFSIDKVSEILHKNNIKVRVFPNICQSSFPETPSLLTFFIRPDDVPAYEPFVDVFELVSDKDRQGIIFKIYKQHKWFGEISEVIPTFKNPLDSRFLLNDFGVFRTRCGKRCLYKPGSCDICGRMVELAATFKKNNIVAIPQY